MALRFLILTATRTSEVLKAEWTEIDLKTAIWTIPAERMKSRREHRVPLTKESIIILRSPANPWQSLYISWESIQSPSIQYGFTSTNAWYGLRSQ
ncbi:tyrosine-type recombinase/integrase [Candidatus Thalassolituus haligoni]|uniref:tyrosine-type recombinase/integrase n=1 Tax=Candidatus Thalassolituus haligoni TaxID=3100113 RepID=UPI0035154717